MALVLLVVWPVAGRAQTDPSLPGWLTGCWRLERGGTVVEEQWLGPRGGLMLGLARTVRDGVVVEYEFLRLRQEETGLAYVAHPSGQPAATFRTRAPGTAGEVSFEAPEHDFPQRIGYRRLGPDSVLAWIEGTERGRTRRIRFPYQRVGCGPGD